MITAMPPASPQQVMGSLNTRRKVCARTTFPEATSLTVADTANGFRFSLTNVHSRHRNGFKSKRFRVLFCFKQGEGGNIEIIEKS